MVNTNDLGVYLSCCDEDLTIVPAWKAVSKVFPQVKVLDVGSRDTSISLLKKAGADIIPVPVMTDKKVQLKWAPLPRQAYVAVKNHYVNQHKWVFWVDGDEVWPEEELKKIVPTINSGRYDAYRIGWKFATNHSREGKVLYDNHVMTGDTKVFRGDLFKWHRTYPDEYFISETGKMQPHKDGASFWCWHLRYMARSTLPPKNKRRGIRRYKTKHWLEPFDKVSVNKFPWEN